MTKITQPARIIPRFWQSVVRTPRGFRAYLGTDFLGEGRSQAEAKALIDTRLRELKRADLIQEPALAPGDADTSFLFFQRCRAAVQACAATLATLPVDPADPEDLAGQLDRKTEQLVANLTRAIELDVPLRPALWEMIKSYCELLAVIWLGYARADKAAGDIESSEKFGSLASRLLGLLEQGWSLVMKGGGR